MTLTIGARRALLGPSYDPDAASLFARFTGEPDRSRKALISTTISSLKAADLWAKLDALWMIAAHDSQAARRNWIADQFNLTAVASPTFLADRYYSGDGTAAQLSTGINLSTLSGRFSLDSSAMGVWALNTPAEVSRTLIGSTNSAIAVSTSAANAVCRPNRTVSIGIGTGVLPGHLCWARGSSALWESYANGVDSGGGTDVSQTLSNEVVALLSRAGSGFATNQIALAHVGANLTSAEVATLYAISRTYLQAVGAVA